MLWNTEYQAFIPENNTGYERIFDVCVATRITREPNLIIRSITFPPEYHQAGISILNYFGEVLRKKFPATKAKIQIKQEGLRVTMIIEPSDGSDKQIIEKALDDYGLVVTGKMEPEKFTEDRIMLIELRSELRTAFNKIELQKELIQDKNIQIDKLLSIVGTAVQSHPQVSVFQDQNNCPSLNHTNAQTIESLVQSENIETLNQNREKNMGDTITINAKGDAAFGKDQAIVTINKTISNADIPETLENKLKQLTQIVEQLSAEKTVPEDQSKNITRNLERFVTEAAKSEPEKQWCQITGKGLIEAAQTVGSIAKPVIETTQVILKMLGL